jgi:hypothetical protein
MRRIALCPSNEWQARHAKADADYRLEKEADRRGRARKKSELLMARDWDNEQAARGRGVSGLQDLEVLAAYEELQQKLGNMKVEEKIKHRSESEAARVAQVMSSSDSAEQKAVSLYRKGLGLAAAARALAGQCSGKEYGKAYALVRAAVVAAGIKPQRGPKKMEGNRT